MDMFSALADPTRRTIIEMLAAKGQLSASDISQKFRMSPPAVSQHLNVLKTVNLVTVEKKAQQRIYSINSQKIEELEKWISQLKHNWENSFDKLDTLLQREKAQKIKNERR